MYPGALPMVRANLFNVILVLDLSYTSSLSFISGPMSNLLGRDLPLRFGVVPQVETVDGTLCFMLSTQMRNLRKISGKKMARLFYYLIKNYGRKKTLAFLVPVCVTQNGHTIHVFLTNPIQLAQMQLPPLLKSHSVNWLAVSTSYNTLIAAELEQDPNAPNPDLQSILEGDVADAHPPFEKIVAYTERLNATSPNGHVFFNGKHLDMGDVCSFFYIGLTVGLKTNRGRFMKNLMRQLQFELNQQMSFLQGKVGHHLFFSKQISENLNSSERCMKIP
jgi:UDP-glucose:glycoprotein glucosyltransferase